MGAAALTSSPATLTSSPAHRTRRRRESPACPPARKNLRPARISPFLGWLQAGSQIGKRTGRAGPAAGTWVLGSGRLPAHLATASHPPAPDAEGRETQEWGRRVPGPPA